MDGQAQDQYEILGAIADRAEADMKEILIFGEILSDEEMFSALIHKIKLRLADAYAEGYHQAVYSASQPIQKLETKTNSKTRDQNQSKNQSKNQSRTR